MQSGWLTCRARPTGRWGGPFHPPGILLLVSYDLAVWEGPQPATDADGEVTFENLFRRYLDGDWPTEPVAHVAAFAEALLKRWPEDSENSPYPSGISVSGPIAYIALSYSRAGEVSLYSAELAARFGLVCFDPQMRRVRPATAENSPGHSRRNGRVLPPGRAGRCEDEPQLES